MLNRYKVNLSTGKEQRNNNGLMTWLSQITWGENYGESFAFPASRSTCVSWRDRINIRTRSRQTELDTWTWTTVRFVPLINYWYAPADISTHTTIYTTGWAAHRTRIETHMRKDGGGRVSYYVKRISVRHFSDFHLSNRLVLAIDFHWPRCIGVFIFEKCSHSIQSGNR